MVKMFHEPALHGLFEMSDGSGPNSYTYIIIPRHKRALATKQLEAKD